MKHRMKLGYEGACSDHVTRYDELGLEHYVIGYRIEYWPREEIEIQRMLTKAGLVDVKTSRLTWQDSFETGGRAYDFFAAVSASHKVKKVRRYAFYNEIEAVEISMVN
jgi:hypothetical protein